MPGPSKSQMRDFGVASWEKEPHSGEALASLLTDGVSNPKETHYLQINSLLHPDGGGIDYLLFVLTLYSAGLRQVFVSRVWGQRILY